MEERWTCKLSWKWVGLACILRVRFGWVQKNVFLYSFWGTYSSKNEFEKSHHWGRTLSHSWLLCWSAILQSLSQRYKCFLYTGIHILQSPGWLGNSWESWLSKITNPEEYNIEFLFLVSIVREHEQCIHAHFSDEDEWVNEIMILYSLRLKWVNKVLFVHLCTLFLFLQHHFLIKSIPLFTEIKHWWRIDRG